MYKWMEGLMCAHTCKKQTLILSVSKSNISIVKPKKAGDLSWSWWDRRRPRSRNRLCTAAGRPSQQSGLPCAACARRRSNRSSWGGRRSRWPSWWTRRARSSWGSCCTWRQTACEQTAKRERLVFEFMMEAKLLETVIPKNICIFTVIHIPVAVSDVTTV